MKLFYFAVDIGPSMKVNFDDVDQYLLCTLLMRLFFLFLLKYSLFCIYELALLSFPHAFLASCRIKKMSDLDTVQAMVIAYRSISKGILI